MSKNTVIHCPKTYPQSLSALADIAIMAAPLASSISCRVTSWQVFISTCLSKSMRHSADSIKAENLLFSLEFFLVKNVPEKFSCVSRVCSFRSREHYSQSFISSDGRLIYDTLTHSLTHKNAWETTQQRLETLGYLGVWVKLFFRGKHQKLLDIAVRKRKNEKY